MFHNTNLSIDFNWIPFHVVGCTSEDYSSPADHLTTTQYNSTQKSWECGRTAQYPIEIVFRFHSRIQLDHILIATKYDKPIPRAEFQIGDGLNGGFQDCEYRLSGRCENINNRAVQVKLQGIGTFLKILITEQPKRSPHNPTAQVSIATMKIWGAVRLYHVRNEQLELLGNRDTIDKLLIGMGIPIDLLNWFDEDDRNFDYAPIDPDTKETLNDLKRIRRTALQMQDYEALKSLKTDMRMVLELGQKIWGMRRDLGLAVAKEDFGRAIQLKQRLKDLERERDRIDALYETSRYDKIVALNRPNTAEYVRYQRILIFQFFFFPPFLSFRHLEILDNQEKMNSESLKKQRDLEEFQRRRVVQIQADEYKVGVAEAPVESVSKPWWENKNDGGDEVVVQKRSKNKKKQNKSIEEEDPLPNFNNPFAFNEGDVDMELYLNPLLATAGEKLPEVPHDVLRRLQHLGYLNVFGARCWNGINGESWRVREAVSQAVLNFLEMPLPQRYAKNTKKLFLSSMEMARLAMEDKIMQNYFVGLKILSTTLAPPVCGTDVSPQVINKTLKEFCPILIHKIEELNYRARDISLHTLMSVFRHPAAKVGILVQSCLDKLIMDPNYKSLFIPPDKQPQRVMISKLEVMLNVLQEFGYDENEFSHEDIFYILAAPSLFHPANEVRLLSIEVIASLYQLVGQDIRSMIDSIENLKPGLREQIHARLDSIDEEHGPIQNDKGLSLIMEQEEDKSPPQRYNAQPQGIDSTLKPINQTTNKSTIDVKSPKIVQGASPQNLKPPQNNVKIQNVLNSPQNKSPQNKSPQNKSPQNKSQNNLKSPQNANQQQDGQGSNAALNNNQQDGKVKEATPKNRKKSQDQLQKVVEQEPIKVEEVKVVKASKKWYEF